MTHLPKQTQWTLEEIAERVSGAVLGATDTLFSGVASVEEAREGDLVFAESAKFLARALASKATAVLVNADLVDAGGVYVKPLVLVSSARIAFVSVLEMMAPDTRRSPGAHPSAQIDPTAVIDATAFIGANAVIEAGAQIGARAQIGAGVFVGQDCIVGEDTTIHPNVVLYAGVAVGRRCILHAGVVLGADGFGYVPVGYGLRKTPHLGSVRIGDEVEIGANACIDRAKTGVTSIGDGTKIDNLVHIAHNCTIGRSVVLVAQTGIAGGVAIGDGAILGGQAGVADHITIGAGARLVGRPGVITDIPAGVTYSGYPAKPHTDARREWVALARMPEALKRLKRLEERLAALEGASDATEETAS